MEFQEVKRITLTMREAADYLGISYWLRKKQIPYSKLGGKFLFRVKALDDYLCETERASVR